MKISLDNLKYKQGVINRLLDKLTPLQDVVKINTTNITNNYNISQISKKKSEFNMTLIDNHTNNIETINSTSTDFENNLSDLKKDISDDNKLIQNNISLISSNKKNIGKHIINFVQLFEIDENSDYKFNRNNNQFTILDEYFLDQSFKIGYLEISYDICIFMQI